MGEYRAQLSLVRKEAGVPRHAININVRLFSEGKNWVGVCEELGTSAYADSIEEAQAQVAEAVTLHLNEVERLGFIDEFFRTHGVVIMRIPDSSPETKSRSSEWELAVAGK